MRRSHVTPVVSSAAVAGLIVVALIAIFLGARIVETVNTEAQSVTSLNELPEVPIGIEGVAEWLPDVWLREREMEPATRVAVESAYVRAWNSLNEYQRSGSKSVVFDSFSGDARDRIQNVMPDFSTASVGISHSLELSFYALDGATVAFRDVGAQFVRSVHGPTGPVIVLSKESFDVIMVLEDGYWRIRQLVRVHSESPIVVAIGAGGETRLQGAIFRDAQTVVDYASTNYLVDATKSSEDRATDLRLIKDLGFTAVRLSIDVDSLSHENPINELPDIWEMVMDEVQHAGLSAIAVVIPAAPESLDDWPLNYAVATRVISRIANHDALLMWDLAHQPDSEFSRDQAPQAIAYVYQLGEYVDAVADQTPVTVTWDSLSRASDQTLAEMVDVVSVHLGENDDVASALRVLRPLQRDVAIVIDIPSTRSGWTPVLASEGRQAATVSARLLDIKSVALARWTLGQLRDTAVDSRGLVDEDRQLRDSATLFIPGADLPLDPPPIWEDAIRSPFWLSVIALLGLLVTVIVLTTKRPSKARARVRKDVGRD